MEKDILIMKTEGHFYPVIASGKKPLKDEAFDHAVLNPHLDSIEDFEGNVLWQREIA